MLRPLVLILTLCALLVSFSPAHADEETLTLLPDASHEYRFDYKGDRTEITIVVDAPEGVELSVYSPEQNDPIGRGARRGNELVWAGKSRAPGVYRAVVANKTPGPILYSLAVLGESVSNVAQVIEDTAPPSAHVSARGGRLTLTVDLPPNAGTRALRLTSPVVPAECTAANQLPPIITTSIKLCPQEIYPPLRVSGNGIGLFADDARTSIINSAGREFAVTLEGSGNWIEGVMIQSSPDAADAGAFMCQYDECVFATLPEKTILRGSIAYGGGILIKGSNTTVHNVTVRGGTLGVATVNGRGNYIIGNNLSDLNGWGNFNLASVGSYFIGNTFNRDNHGCKTPDGFKFEHGCETAGWVCLACNNNLIARNHCELSGNCYYMSGERGLGSHNNRFVANYCAGSPNNCFEFTFSKGNVLIDNIATADPQTGAACKYPFWIGGSTVYFSKNTWQCTITPQESIEHATRSTDIATIVLPFDGTTAPNWTQPQPTPTSTPTAKEPRCSAKFRVQRLFSWQRLLAWVRCISRPKTY